KTTVIVDCTNATTEANGLIDCGNVEARPKPTTCSVSSPDPSVACAKDADCMAGDVCYCGESGGQCVHAFCVTSADCGTGECVLYQAPLLCQEVATEPRFAC